MENKHPSDMTLPELYLHMKANPGDRETQLAYYKSLADGRLADFYTLSDVIEEMKRGFELIHDIATRFADGHDEINEYTPEPYIKLLEGYLDAISKMCVRGMRGELPVDD